MSVKQNSTLLKIKGSNLNPLASLAIACLGVAAGLVVQLGLNTLTDRPLIFTFFAAIIYVSWRAGFWAGVFAIVLSCLASDFFIFEPAFLFHLDNAQDLFTLLSFTIVAIPGAWFTAYLAKNSLLSHLAQTELQMTLKSIGDGVLVIDRDRQISFLNPIAETLTGWSNEEAYGRPMEEVFRILDQNTRKSAFNPVEKVFKDGKVVGLANHTVLISKDGTEYQIEDSAAPIFLKGQEKVSGVILVFRDVTLKYATEQHASETRAKFEAVIQELSDGIIISDSRGGNFQMNSAALKLHGFLNPEDMCNHLEKYPDIFKLETTDGHFIEPQNWPMARVLKGEKFQDVEVVVSRLDSKRKFVGNYSGTPILDGKGQVRLAVLTLRDASERSAMEAQLRFAKVEAESASALKTSFLANMSHEIRTPLGAMIGFADLLKEPSITNAERASYVDILTRNGHQLSHIINDILDLSKVESGHFHIESMAANPALIAGEVVSLLNVLAKEKGLILELNISKTLPRQIVTDSNRLRQILTNVVGNALKFTRQGKVSINVFTFAEDSLGDTIGFEVSDTGVGIDTNDVLKLFQVFSQADVSVTRKFGGTGLGLALSKKLAEALMGDVILKETEKNKGSTFLITIKSKEKLVPNEKPVEVELNAVEENNKSLKGIHVLLVEDSPDNQQLICRMLAKHGVTMELANNGLEGIEKATDGHHDIILIDLQMPVMDGYTATKKLRAQGYTKPIIALTAHAMSEVRLKCLNAGCTDHLPKPINFVDLVETIARHTDTSHA